MEPRQGSIDIASAALAPGKNKWEGGTSRREGRRTGC